MPTVWPLPCAAVATLSALDRDVADSMITVQPLPPGQSANDEPVPVPLSSGVAVAFGSGVVVAFGSGVVVAFGSGVVVSVGSGETVGVAVGDGVVVAGGGTAADGVGVACPSFSPPPDSAAIASTIPI